MKLATGLLLTDCVLVGVGLTYLTRLKFRVEERVAFGAVIGFVVMVVTGFAVGWIAGGLSSRVVAVAALIATALSLPGWRVGRNLIAEECRDFAARLRLPLANPDSPAPLLMLAVPAWAITVWILNLAYLPDGVGGVYAGALPPWGADWPVHMAYASSFAFSENFPPSLPLTLAGDRLTYYFGVDFFAAMLDRFGLSTFGGQEVASGYLAFAFVPTMYLAGVRFLASRAAAAVAVLVFTGSGGLGWLRFLHDVAGGGWGIIWDLPTDYTRHYQGNIVLENIVTGHLYPQRPTLAGFSMLLIAAVLLREAYLSRSHPKFTATGALKGGAAVRLVSRGQGSRRALLMAGVLVGVMPLFHAYSFGVAMSLGIIWGILARQRKWWWFAIPASALALPLALLLRPMNADIIWEVWVNGPWMQTGGGYSAEQDNFFTFWWRNAGIFLVLMAVAQMWRNTLPRLVLWASIPVWLIFFIANVARIGPSHPWNNTHWFALVLLLGAFLVGAVLVRLARLNWLGAAAAAALFATLTFSGALGIWKVADPESVPWPVHFMTKDEVAAATWVRDHTPADSVMLTGSQAHRGVPQLTGRQMVYWSGAPYDLGVRDYWLWEQRTTTMLAGEDGTEGLLVDLGVDYVVIGPAERERGANEGYWAVRGTQVFANTEFAIYKVNEP